MANKRIIPVETITEMHRLLGLPAPAHPLVSVVRSDAIPASASIPVAPYRIDLYTIACKRASSGSFTYGRGSYDFQEGSLVCTGPGQVITPEADHLERDRGSGGWSMFVHPDFLSGSPIANPLSAYSFFGYGVSEALHLSERERVVLEELAGNIERETDQHVDRHSRDLILVNLESILKYTRRFYDRQFYTRSGPTGGHLARFEAFLAAYFESDELAESGLPSVARCGEALNMSGHYLSDLLRAETGKSAREHIHLRLVERAKDVLLGSEATVSEVAYGLGFGYPQHFSTLFRAKVGMSPTEWRRMN